MSKKNYYITSNLSGKSCLKMDGERKYQVDTRIQKEGITIDL
ncbi:hypothetical protein [Roseivirga pacifica]|nr:hypothetical protein [Roseivirga pacifica]